MAIAINTATRLQDASDVNVTPNVGVDEYALVYDHDTAKFVLRAPPDLSGYALLAGRAGGQTLYGGTAANDDITIHGTSNATRTTSYVILQPTAGFVGIGTSTPTQLLSVAGAISRGISSASLAIYGGNDYTDSGYFQVYGLTGGSTVDQRGGAEFVIRNTATFKIISYDGSAWTDKFTIRGTGNVGIGTTSPATALHVVGAATITAGIRPAADSTTALQLQNVAGTSVLNVDTTNGRVGIGTTSPVVPFHVVGNTTFYPLSTSNLVVNLAGQSPYGTELNITSSNASAQIQLRVQSWYMGQVYNTDVGTFHLGTSLGSSMFAIKPTGFVGIGTTSPATALHVVGAATITAGIRPAADSITALQLQNASGTSVLNVDTTNGRVGIGTTAPTVALDVTGSGYLSGTLGIGLAGSSIIKSNLYVRYNTLSASAFGSKIAIDIGQAGSGNSIRSFRALNTLVATTTGYDGNLTDADAGILGLSATVAHYGTGTVTAAVGATFGVENNGSGTITNATALKIASIVKSGGIITNTYGLYIAAQAAGATNYAIYTNAGKVRLGDIVNFAGTMGDSAKNPATDAPADWVQVEINGTPYYIPAYTAS